MREFKATGPVSNTLESHGSRLTTHDSNEIFIQVKDLVHIYNRGKRGEFRALSGVSLEIKKGEFLAVVGPNGSGKSTLIMHFNALLTPTEGEVIVGGLDTRDPRHIWEIRRQVGIVFQNPDNQIVSSLLEEDVAFGVENLGLPPEEVRERVEEALSLTGLSGVRDRPPHLLSGGQKQRLAVAGVLAMCPACLVLDEPSSMLDPAGRAELMETLVRLNRSGRVTVILVTHFMEDAARADKIIVMNEGRLVLTGPPDRVFAEHALLDEINLALPAAAEISRGLRRRGFPVPDGILSLDDLVSFLCRR
ncbi:energy-coupling factor transporter ATPase [Pelotomaculum propionicicum]|uniref:Energy-coupling factor transporter ATP-binding protein EcfA2 n=1 Tax=Pelotomaculum propionicicum TaxID=258475 RepID=A0A4Y7RSL0_9FIRM|nr:energy-coupling factor transporter ATPase [Pelotomaculum propionicicum]NLI11399.1 energy-coupling factor transporter ATPase [Peptococcaceae bacterium]TEB11709.1 Energy-coupling factor transporter ATP-binding protein EcfA2 [Pelotomaculum propionicicum]